MAIASVKVLCAAAGPTQLAGFCSVPTPLSGSTRPTGMYRRSAVRNQLIDGHVDVACNLTQKDRGDVPTCVVRYGCGATVGVPVLLV